MNAIEINDVFNVIGVANDPVHNGTLSLGRRPARGEHILTRIDAGIAFRVMATSLLKAYPDISQDYFDTLCTHNGGVFPEDQLVAALETELAPHAGTIRFDGNRPVRVKLGGRKLIGYGRGVE